MEGRLAEVGPGQLSFELNEELADSVEALILDERLPVQAIPYVLAYPDSTIGEVLSARPLDHKRATRWLGKAVVSQEATDTLADFVRGRTTAGALLSLLAEIHSGDVPPPPKVEELMRGSSASEEDLPAVLRGVFGDGRRPSKARPASASDTVTPLFKSDEGIAPVGDEPTVPVDVNRPAMSKAELREQKQQTMERYLSVANGVRAAIRRKAGESELPYQRRLAKEGVAGILTALGASDEEAQDVFTTKVRELACRASPGSFGDAEQIPDFSAAVTFVTERLGSFIDAADTRMTRSGDSDLPQKVDRFMLTLLGVDGVLIAEKFEASVGAFRMLNRRIRKAIIAQPEAKWVEWDGNPVTAVDTTDKASYIDGLKERHDTWKTLDAAQLYEEVVNAQYLPHQAELYLRQLADYSELLMQRGGQYQITLMDSMGELVGSYIDLDELVSVDKSATINALAGNPQASLEVALTVVAKLLKAEDNDKLPATLNTIRAFWILIHTGEAEEQTTADHMYRQVAQSLPDMKGLTIGQVRYLLRYQSHNLMRARYNSSIALGAQSEHSTISEDRRGKKERVRLSENQIFELARLYAQRVKSREIARQYGLTDLSQVSHYVRRAMSLLEDEPGKDPELLTALRQRYEENAARIGRRNAGTQVRPAAKKTVTQTVSPKAKQPRTTSRKKDPAVKVTKPQHESASPDPRPERHRPMETYLAVPTSASRVRAELARTLGGVMSQNELTILFGYFGISDEEALGGDDAVGDEPVSDEETQAVLRKISVSGLAGRVAALIARLE